MEYEYFVDSDRFTQDEGTFEGVRVPIFTCKTCYCFRSCSSIDPNRRADGCYVCENDLEAVNLQLASNEHDLVAGGL